MRSPCASRVNISSPERGTSDGPSPYPYRIADIVLIKVTLHSVSWVFQFHGLNVATPGFRRNSRTRVSEIAECSGRGQHCVSTRRSCVWQKRPYSPGKRGSVRHFRAKHRNACTGHAAGRDPVFRVKYADPVDRISAFFRSRCPNPPGRLSPPTTGFSGSNAGLSRPAVSGCTEPRGPAPRWPKPWP